MMQQLTTTTDRHGNPGAEKLGLTLIQAETPDVCFDIDKICFSERCYERIADAAKIYGEVYVYRDTLHRVIGYIIYGQVWVEADDNTAYISRIGVLPAYRCRGHASKMLHLIESELRVRRCPAIHADIREDNTASKSLFEKAGYTPIWEDNEMFEKFVAIRYEKSL